ncbi:hypothetical protein DVH24_027416 [Malus domestica]|uniref:Uncharacterized protein n=1 Tax=Malus domestica TaxID=3750 RepID=A0A498H7G6_MALDO|nr:hypothetical protein DVH24_027416 [Malus domestica]
MLVVRPLIDRNGEEFLNRVQSLLSESFHGLKNEPVVVGTYDDLILCANGWYYHNDYFICNPYTMECIALSPPPTQCFNIVPVGIICERRPYYKENNQNGHFMQLNKVVGILPPNDVFNFDPDGHSYDFNMEIFSSETGKWRELAVSSPQGIFI